MVSAPDLRQTCLSVRALELPAPDLKPGIFSFPSTAASKPLRECSRGPTLHRVPAQSPVGSNKSRVLPVVCLSFFPELPAKDPFNLGHSSYSPVYHLTTKESKGAGPCQFSKGIVQRRLFLRALPTQMSLLRLTLLSGFLEKDSSLQ